MTRRRDKYEQAIDGEWFGPIRKRRMREQCCDCALVHIVDYKLTPDNELYFRARRDERATAAARRAKKR